MKKIITSAGLVALGTAGLQAAYAPGLSSMETSKPWSMSATLRGFYDDNYNTAPDKESSFGVVLSPSLGLNLATDQTLLRLSYTYSATYYEDRPKHNWDQSHLFDGVLNHTFSERYSVDLNETFVIAQEPSLLDPDGGTRLRRTEGNNIRNRAAVNFNAQLTPLLDLLLGYVNTLVDYEQNAGDVKPSGSTPSRSALLDRMENLMLINLRCKVQPETTGVLGYQFGLIDYTSDEFVDVPFNTVRADRRNSRSHYVYLGADHNFRPDLSLSARLGGQYIEYYNDPTSDSVISPYVDTSLAYNYAPGSFVRIGVRHARNATDVSVLDQESTGVYGQLNHQITPNLTGSILGQIQYSVNNGSALNGRSPTGTNLDDTADTLYLVGLNLSYRFNQHLSAEAGYNFDRDSSELKDRSFSRNRVYVGVTATY